MPYVQVSFKEMVSVLLGCVLIVGLPMMIGTKEVKPEPRPKAADHQCGEKSPNSTSSATSKARKQKTDQSLQQRRH
jgi:hypothetical protein